MRPSCRAANCVTSGCRPGWVTRYFMIRLCRCCSSSPCAACWAWPRISGRNSAPAGRAWRRPPRRRPPRRWLSRRRPPRRQTVILIHPKECVMSEWSHATELPWLWAGLTAYALATFISFRGVMTTRSGAAGAAVSRSYETPVFILVIAGVLLLAMALAERWMRIGHGPFVNLFELLMSQLFSLVLLLEPTVTPYPPTYFNNWLWAHVGLGKIFLGFCLMGTGISRNHGSKRK